MKNKYLLGVMAIGVFQAACGAAEDQPTPGVNADGTAALGAYGPDVLEARTYLTKYGYFPNAELSAQFSSFQPMLPASEGDPQLFDETLELALTKYQRNMGLAPSGELDPSTLAAMHTERCGVPDVDPDAAEVDKWALLGSKWPKTTMKYRIAQPNVTLKGMASAAATRAAVADGFALWAASTHVTFTQVTSGEDVIVDYRNAGNLYLAHWDGVNTITINSISDFSSQNRLRMATGHEVGHALGLHHSSNFVTDTNGFPVSSVPLMAPSGNTSGTLANDDKIGSNVLHNGWEQVSGAAYDIGIGSNGTVWIIHHTTRQPRVYTGAGWTEHSTGVTMSRVDVDNIGRPWAVAANNNIYRRVNDVWELVPGNGKALDIGIGKSGNVWVIGTDGRLYKFTGNGWSFWGGPTGSTSLDVDGSGNVHVVAANNVIWSCGATCSPAAGGLGLDIGYAAPLADPFALENWGWAIGLNDTIWARNRQRAIPNANPLSDTPAADGWVQSSGLARRIAVTPNGRPWVVTSSGEIYRRRELQ